MMASLDINPGDAVAEAGLLAGRNAGIPAGRSPRLAREWRLRQRKTLEWFSRHNDDRARRPENILNAGKLTAAREISD